MRSTEKLEQSCDKTCSDPENSDADSAVAPVRISSTSKNGFNICLCDGLHTY